MGIKPTIRYDTAYTPAVDQRGDDTADHQNDKTFLADDERNDIRSSNLQDSRIRDEGGIGGKIPLSPPSWIYSSNFIPCWGE